MIDPLLTAREGAALIPCSLPTWWRWVANGTLPPAVKLGGMSRWPQSEILAVIEKAKAARNATKKNCQPIAWDGGSFCSGLHD